MGLSALHHLQLAMPEGGEAKARGFYGDLLGLTEVQKPALLAERGGCWFESGDIKLHLGVEPAFIPARKAHPAFLVSDLADLLRALAAAGVTVTEDLPLEGFERRYIADPFGNRIELLQPNALGVTPAPEKGPATKP